MTETSTHELKETRPPFSRCAKYLLNKHSGVGCCQEEDPMQDMMTKSNACSEHSLGQRCSVVNQWWAKAENGVEKLEEFKIQRSRVRQAGEEDSPIKSLQEEASS